MTSKEIEMSMRAMVLMQPHTPLQMQVVPKPIPAKQQVQVRVLACGICRTDLHVLDGELPHPKLPLIPGHQIVGEVTALGAGATRWCIGEVIGIPWLSGSCGCCRFCKEGRENLCDAARYTGYQSDGGFAEYAVAREDYCFAIPAGYSAEQAAPLLCAGLIGYRAYRMAGSGEVLGLYGFGAAAHLLIQVARFEGRRVFAFTRSGDGAAQQFALQLGAEWAGDSSGAPPELLDAAIIFAPAGELVPAALRVLQKGGRVICAGIHMSDIPQFSYDLLWGERSICSVANLTRRDGEEFLPLAAQIPIHTHITRYALSDVNRALADLRAGNFTGAAVVVP
jgi:propanol-preferring alcohol dehydrogenase